jgi:hypothetical protein
MRPRLRKSNGIGLKYVAILATLWTTPLLAVGGKRAKGGAGSSAIDPATLVRPLPPDKPPLRLLEMFYDTHEVHSPGGDRCA